MEPRGPTDGLCPGAGLVCSSAASVSLVSRPTACGRFIESTDRIAAAEFQRILEKADLFLNVSGGTLMRDEYMRCPCKILIDTDPGWNHFVNYPKWDANPNWHGTHGFRSHDHFFTYAERIGANDCNLPEMGIHWHATRPPVVLECWQPKGQGILHLWV